jgi:hypothetical protein
MTRLALALMAALIAHPAATQSLTNDEIESAIKAGSAGATSLLTCTVNDKLLGSMSRGFTVTVEGPLSRVMRAAADAKKKYRAFTIANVTEEMVASTVVIVATPHAPKLERSGWKQSPPVEHMVLKRLGVKNPGPTDVLQPTAHETVESEWSNAMGGKFEGRGIVATFDLEAFRNMPAGTLEAVLITSDGERSCTLAIRNRATFR